MDVTKIYGPPGTGKTTRLIELLREEMKRVPADRIAFLSHTNAAADVIAERLPGADRKWFRTIHSACARRLGIARENIVDPVDYAAFSKHTGFKILSERSDGLVEDGQFYVANNYGPVLKAYDLSRLTGRNIHEVIATMPTHPSLARAGAFLKAWEAYKDRNGLFDFTDMLTRYLYSDIGPLPCTSVFLDEGQDCSELQWLVFNKFIGEAERVYLAGDDDQAIYGFMGGSEFGFLEYPASREEVLRTSYRVPKHIGERATRIIRRLPKRKDKDVTWQDGEGAILRVNLGPLNLPWRSWSDKKVLVLTRHRANALAFSKEITKIAVSHSLGQVSLNTSNEAKLVRTYYRMKHGEAVGWRDLKKFFAAVGDSAAVDRIAAVGLADKDATLDARDLPSTLWDDKDWMVTLAEDRKSLEKMRSIALLVKREGIEVVGSEPSVAVMTMHAAKGREADIIVIDPACNQTVKDRLQTPGEVRLAYVALTRAKEKVIVLSPRTNRWITHLTGA